MGALPAANSPHVTGSERPIPQAFQYCTPLSVHLMSRWTQFTVDCKIATKGSKSTCTRSDCDRIFMELDAMGTRLDKETEALQEGFKGTSTKSGGGLERQLAPKSNRSKALSRIEFMVGLVRLAVQKYVLSGLETDMSAALERVVGVDILSRMGNTLPDPDSFRLNHCYTQSVVNVLHERETSLRNLFGALAQLSGSRHLINFDLWKAFLRAIDFIGVLRKSDAAHAP